MNQMIPEFKNLVSPLPRLMNEETEAQREEGTCPSLVVTKNTRAGAQTRSPGHATLLVVGFDY